RDVPWRIRPRPNARAHSGRPQTAGKRAEGAARLPANARSGAEGRVERFRAKWIPVRVKKTRQTKNLEPRSDAIGTGKALGPILPANGTNPRLARTQDRS